MTQIEKIELLKDVEDLILQATVEKSHFYTAKILRDCRELILESLEKES